MCQMKMVIADAFIHQGICDDQTGLGAICHSRLNCPLVGQSSFTFLSTLLQSILHTAAQSIIP